MQQCSVWSAILVGLVLSMTLPADAQQDSEYEIVLVSNRDRKSDIYAVGLANGNTRRLTDVPGHKRHPDCSSDGRYLAYTAFDIGGSDIYVMDLRSGAITQVTNYIGYDTEPAWSPDGEQLAYISKQGGDYDVHIMTRDGRDSRNLTEGTASHCKSPSWSPDGQWLAFTAFSGEGYNIYVMSVDGQNFHQFVDQRFYDGDPSWSPDGNKIAFWGEGPGEGKIYIKEVVGETPSKILTQGLPGRHDTPSWSPDGGWMAFASYGDGNGEIYVMDADGNNPRNLTNHPASDTDPVWLNTTTQAVGPTGKLATLWSHIKHP